MIQCFRFMGMPDKVLAFDELPKRFLDGFELCRAEGFPRHWKEWMGKIEKVTKIPPEKDLLTGGVRRFDPIVDVDSFFYLVDWNLKQNEERWQELCSYVRSVVGKDVRLLDKLEDMAVPLAGDKISAIDLEPENVPVIPIPKEAEKIIVTKPTEPVKAAVAVEENSVKCDECDYKASGKFAKNGLRLHMKKHKKEPIAA